MKKEEKIAAVAAIVGLGLLLRPKGAGSKKDFVTVNPDGTCPAGYVLHGSAIAGYSCVSLEYVREHPELYGMI